MKKEYLVVVEFCKRTKQYVGHVPGFPGAHSQGDTLEELYHNMQEVIEMLLEDEEPQMDSKFVKVQKIAVAV